MFQMKQLMLYEWRLETIYSVSTCVDAVSYQPMVSPLVAVRYNAMGNGQQPLSSMRANGMVGLVLSHSAQLNINYDNGETVY